MTPMDGGHVLPGLALLPPATKPAGRLHLNRRHPLAAGLVGCWVMQAGREAENLCAPGQAATIGSANARPGPSPHGVVWEATAATETLSIAHDSGWKPTAAMTCIGRVAVTDVQDALYASDNGSNTGFGAYTNGGALRAYVNIAGTFADQIAFNPYVQGVYYDVGFSYRNGTFWAITNGVRVTSQSISGTISHSSVGLAVGDYSPGFGSDNQVSVSFLLIWDRELSEAELLLAHLSPWVLVEPADDQALLADPATGQTVATGLSSETDTALAVGRLKAKAVGLSSETDTALTARPLRTHAIGQAAETDTAGTVGWSKSRTVGQAAETDSALAARPLRTHAIGQASETDTALAAAHAKARTIGLPSETDSALAAVPLRTHVAGQASEADSAPAAGRLKLRAIGQALETDTALPVSGAGAVGIGQAAESDSAFPVGRIKTKAAGQASETDGVLPAVPLRSRAIGPAAETDQALAARPLRVHAVGAAAEADAAFAAAVRRALAIGLAIEADSAPAATARRAYLLGLAAETNQALAVTAHLGPTIVGRARRVVMAARVRRVRLERIRSVPAPARVRRVLIKVPPEGHAVLPLVEYTDKHPVEKDYFELDATPILAEGETITTSTWTLVSGLSGLTFDNITHAAPILRARGVGGTDGTDYQVEVFFVTNAGRELMQICRIPVTKQAK